jgi:hypothetical protein
VATTGFTKNFVVKNGLTTGAITLDGLTGNISGTNQSLTGNLTVTGKSNLGNVGNVSITGGQSGYIISTDGSGNLNFISPSSTQSPAPMPTYVPVGDVLTISANYQGIFGYPITIDGQIVVDGILIDVNDATIPGGVINTVQFNDGTQLAGTTNFTFVSTTGILSVPNVTTTGVVKTTATTYSGLPLAGAAGAGARSFITDADTTTFLATVGGGGSNAVPVVSNGSTWIVG